MGICNHHLPVETGTCNNIGKRLRTCEIRIIGGEFCYIMECAHFSNERKNRFFNKRVCKNLNIMKSNELMNTNNVIVWQDYSSLINVQLSTACLFIIQYILVYYVTATWNISFYMYIFASFWFRVNRIETLNEGGVVGLFVEQLFQEQFSIE